MNPSPNAAPMIPNQQAMPDEVAALLNAGSIQYSAKLQGYINKAKALSARLPD